MAETQEYGYDCATGALKEKVSEPGQGAKALVTRGTYDDFGRVQGEAVYSGGTLLRQTQTSYDDGQRWVRVASSLDGASDMRLSAVHWFDGMGSLRLSRSSDDSGGAVTASSAGGVVTERAWRYFVGGRYEVESKGWRPVAAAGVAEPPRAWVTRRLDAAGRLVAVETFAAKPYPWGAETNAMGGVSYVYSGNVTVETDAAGRTREETRDGMGRLTMVRQGQENPALYGYNGRDLLTGGNADAEFRIGRSQLRVLATEQGEHWAAVSEFCY